MKNILWKIVITSLIAIFGGSACQQATLPTPSATWTVGPDLTPYVFATPTPTPTLSPLPLQTQAPALPTPTPLTHIIREGDTLLAIAARYNTTVDRIVVANPDVNSNLLIVGEEIIIPSGEGESAAHLPTATPFPLELQPPHCLPSRDGGVWCFVKVTNSLNLPFENVSAAVSLYIPDEETTVSEVAISLLNILYPQQTIPLVVYFPAPVSEDFQARGTLLTSLPASRQEALAVFDLQNVDYSSSRQQATLTGTIYLREESDSPQQVWIVGVAYDIEENVIGVRKWMTSDKLSPGQSIPFTLTVFSLGSPIAEVNIFGEAHD